MPNRTEAAQRKLRHVPPGGYSHCACSRLHINWIPCAERPPGLPFLNVKLLVMSAHSVAPGAQQKRFAAYLNRLAQAAGHLDRVVPLKSYCTGLLLPGEGKSVEPMAARLCSA